MWLARVLLNEIYTAYDPAGAQRRLLVFIHAADAEVPELLGW